MSKESGLFGRAVGLLVGIGITVGGPGVIGFLQPSWLKQHKILAILLFLTYELGVMLAISARAIVKDLIILWRPRVVAAVDNWAQRWISRFGRKLLKNAVITTSYVEQQGLTTRGEYTFQLDQTFINLSLDTHFVHALDANPILYWDLKKGVDPKTIWFWLSKTSKDRLPLAIVGPPGSGKTTLLHHVANVLARGGRVAWKHRAPKRLPIIVNLRDFKDEFLSKEPPNLVEILGSVIRSKNLKEPPAWVETQLMRGRLILLLDGLDEVANATARRSVVRWVDRQQQFFPETLFIVTSRPFGYKDNPLSSATVLQVRPFTIDQIQSFIHSWYTATTIRSYGGKGDAVKLKSEQGAKDLWAALVRQPELLDLASNPLLLTMIANVHHYRAALPGSRSELYKEICEVFLGKRHQARSISLDMTAAQRQVVLQRLAFTMMRERTRSVSTSEAENILATFLATVSPNMLVSDFLRTTEETSGLLVETEADIYGFAHLTFQEYLAACHIKESDERQLLADNVSDPWWRETIRLFAATADATEIIDSCLVDNSDISTLSLGLECLEEAREVQWHIREKVESLLTPPDIINNGESRRVAGVLRLLSRSRFSRRMASGARLGVSPITNLEYAAFLEDQNQSRDFEPTDWSDTIRNADELNRPVVGLELAGVNAFCIWASDLSEENGWAFRLPDLYELDSLEDFHWEDGWTHNLNVPVLWMRPQPELLNIRVPDWNEAFECFWSPVEGAGAPIPLDRICTRDDTFKGYVVNSREIEELANRFDANFRLTKQEFYIRTPDSPRYPLGVDLQNLREFIQYTVEFAYDAAYGVNDSASLNLREDLGSLAQFIIDGVAVALAKPVQSQAAPENPHLLKGLQLSALAAASVALDLGTLRATETSKTSRPILAGFTRYFGLKKSLRDPAKDFRALSDAFLRIFSELVALKEWGGRWASYKQALYLVRTDGRDIDEDTLGGFYAESTQARRLGYIVKTTLDRLAAFWILFLMAPLLLAISLIVKLTSRGPVFSSDKRVGQYGRIFHVHRFRAHIIEPQLPGQRLTRFGKFLYRSSLIELPKLINVLAGEMSFLGPRPVHVKEAEQLTPVDYRILTAMRPGVVGLHVLVSSSDGTRQLDEIYVRQWSLAFDASLLIILFIGLFRRASTE